MGYASIFAREEGGEVPNSAELQRVMALPRRALDLQAVKDVTVLFRQDGGTMCFWPRQSAALIEASLLDGLFAPLPVGGGKTLVTLALYEAMNSRRQVLLVPAQLKWSLFNKMLPEYRRHFKLPPVYGFALHDAVFPPGIYVLSYSELSSATKADALDKINPDLIVADEVHNLRHRSAARTKRFLRFFREHPECRFAGLSGTITNRSLMDYCLDPGARVLSTDLRWIKAGDVRPGDSLIGFDEKLGACRFQPTLVEGVKNLVQPKYRITTDKGSVVCSGLHRWVLCEGKKERKHKPARRWIQTDHLSIGDEIAFFVQPWDFDETREGGYLAGLLDGEGWVDQHGKVGFGQKPGVVLDRYIAGLGARGIEYTLYRHRTGVCRVLPKGEAASLRLLGMFRPSRLLEKADGVWNGRRPYGGKRGTAKILDVSPIGDGEVVAIQTGTGTLVAEGMLSHNSHLLELALRKNAPIPLRYHEQLDWAGAIDVKPQYPMEPGALLQLCQPGEDVRSGFRRRLVETPGVVASTEMALGTALYIEQLDLEIPPKVQDLLRQVRSEWAIGDEWFEDTFSYYRALRQLSQGWYYRWIWPDGKKDHEWLDARKNWHKEVRQFLQNRARPGCDSPFLYTQAVLRGEQESNTWAKWDAVRKRYKPTPPTETVWVDDFFVQETVKRARMSDRSSIVWFESKAIGAAVAKAGGLPLYDADKDPVTATEKIIVASIACHGTGKNLQAYSHNLVLSPPSSGTVWEQMIGRTHRPGQEADEVTVEVYGHTFEMRAAVGQAIEDAKYIEATQGSKQKLLYATWVNQ